MSFSFSHQDLRRYGCAASENPGLQPITTPVHPIFAKENFRVGLVEQGIQMFYGQHPMWLVDTDVFPIPVYDRITPALQLASLILENSLPLYAKLICATVLDHATKDKIFDPQFVASDAHITAVRNELLVMAKHTRWYLSASGSDPASITGDKWLGITRSALIESSPRPQLCLGLSYRFLDLIASDKFGQATAKQRSRFLFFFAQVALHEMAHGIFQWRKLSQQWHDPNLPSNRFGRCEDEEPFLNAQDPENELGRAWETWFWGGIIKPVGMSADMKIPFGFYFIKWDDWVKGRQVKAQLGKMEEPRFWGLGMEMLEALFAVEGWQQGVTLQITALKSFVKGVEEFDETVERLFTKHLEAAVGR